MKVRRGHTTPPYPTVDIELRWSSDISVCKAPNKYVNTTRMPEPFYDTSIIGTDIIKIFYHSLNI